MSFIPKWDEKRLLKIAKLAAELGEKPIDKNTASAVGIDIIDEMKRLISRGISPILGNGRFEAYKGVAGSNEKIAKNKLDVKSYTSKQGKFIAREHNKSTISGARKNVYPYSVMDEFPDKKVRPVNLKLSGKFLDALSFKAVPYALGYETEITYKGKEKLKESGHREQDPSRPTIPLKSQGEQFVIAIQRLYTKIFKERIRDLIKKSR